MDKIKSLDGHRFYFSLLYFARKNSGGDEEKRKKIMRAIFKPKYKDWLSFKTIQDFINEYNKHLEWQGKSAKEMQRDIKSGGNGFYQALLRFAINQSGGNKNKQRELMEQIFKPRKSLK